MKNHQRVTLAQKLCFLYDNNSSSSLAIVSYGQDVMKSIGEIDQKKLEFIEYNAILLSSDPDIMIYDFIIRDKNISIGDIINWTEAIPTPIEISVRFPNLNQSDWVAIMRLVTVILAAFALIAEEMPLQDTNKAKFVRKLYSIYDLLNNNLFDVNKFSTEVMLAFLRFGSETPDNQNCYERIEYGCLIEEGHIAYGFKIRENEVAFVLSILSVLENIPIPEKIHKKYPELTQLEWESAVGLAKIVIMAFSPVQN